MTREEIIDGLEIYTVGRLNKERVHITVEELQKFIDAIKALKPESCEDAISRKAVIDALTKTSGIRCDALKALYDLPPVTPQQKIEHCKDCKYFEYDSVARVDGIPLIVAHEICSRWGDGCKTKEGGYCFLFEPQESEEKE